MITTLSRCLLRLRRRRRSRSIWTRWLLLLVVAEMGAWFTLVPESLASSTFVQWNALLALMFATGVASAMAGSPTPSIAQILNDVERREDR
jgi:hypothetical protein